MKFSQFPNLKSSGVRVCSTVPCLIIILAALVCLQQHCHAQQQQPLASQSGMSIDPLRNVNWIPGPQRLALGNIATINIPRGYRFTDVDGARLILASLNDPMPDDIAGILAPVSGKWMAILEYSPRGYVKNTDPTEISTNEVLKQIMNQINEAGQTSIKSLRWQSQPIYDVRRHSLEWSLQLITPLSKVLNQTDILLGRHGVLQVTVAQHLPLTDASASKQAVSFISFKNGERYADYTNGDKIAAGIGLAELITGENQAQPSGFFSGGLGTVVPWIYSGLALCLITGVVVVVRRRNRTHRRRLHHRRTRTHVPAPAIKNKAPVDSLSANPTPVAVKPTPVAIKNTQSNTPAQPQPKPVSNRSNMSKPLYRSRRHRKRFFDNHKFFTKVLGNMSSTYYMPVSMAIRKSHPDDQANSHAGSPGNGNSASSADGHSNGKASSNGINANQTNKPEIEVLIAVQQSLIQEQKSLMDQQSRLIEEKRRLIEEQTAFLKAHADLHPYWPDHQNAA